MKKIYFLLSCQILLSAASAAVLTWDGEAFNNQWQDPLNWVGDRAPLPDDEILLDNSVVAGHYEVVLPAGDVSTIVSRLRIHPDAGYQVRLLLPPANISLVAFRATSDGDAVVLDAGAVFINESGAASSSTPVAVTGSGYFRINNGAHYVHRTARSATDNLISRLSAEAGTETGIFEFDVTVASYIVSLSGRTFGTLVLNAATNNSMVSYRGSGGNPFLVRGDLRILGNASFTLSLSSDATIEGALVTEPSSVFNLQSTDNNNIIRVKGNVSAAGTITETGTGFPTFELAGAGEQQLMLTGPLLNQVAVRINNTVACRLLAPLRIEYLLTLASGRLISTGASRLTLGPVAVCDRLSGLVEGPFCKQLPAGFLFPVGQGSIYAPVKMPGNAGLLATDELTVEYIRANPQTSVGNTYQQSGSRPIGHISQVEYWKLGSTGNLSAVPVFTVTAESFSRDLAATFIVHYSHDNWINLGSAVVNGPVLEGSYQTGELAAIDAFATDGFITLGTNLPFSDNPLPVGIISFTAEKEKDEVAIFKWELGEPPSGSETFVISEVASDSADHDLVTIHSTAGRLMYDYRADFLKPGMNRFRLRIADNGQQLYYSRIVSLQQNTPRSMPELLSVFPSPAAGWTTLRVKAGLATAIELLIHNNGGLLVKRIKTTVSPGNTLIPLSLEDLRSGVYFLTGVTAAGQTNTVCLLRE